MGWFEEDGIDDDDDDDDDNDDDAVEPIQRGPPTLIPHRERYSWTLIFKVTTEGSTRFYYFSVIECVIHTATSRQIRQRQNSIIHSIALFNGNQRIQLSLNHVRVGINTTSNRQHPRPSLWFTRDCISMEYTEIEGITPFCRLDTPTRRGRPLVYLAGRG